MQASVGELRDFINEAVKDKPSFTQQIARYLRKRFLTDPEMWSDFNSKAELRNWLLSSLNDDDTLHNMIYRWARSQINKDELMQALNLDELWSKCRESIMQYYDQHPEEERPAEWRQT